MTKEWLKAVKIIKKGGIAVIPTDTIYGIVTSAVKPKSVENLYKVRFRRDDKPCIVLCSSLDDLLKIGVTIDENTKKKIKIITPNPVSIVLSCPKQEFKYLHRGMETVAIRIPKKKSLREFLSLVGPIIAPSANLEGEKPAKNIIEAKKYFAKNAQIYISGRVVEKPSTLIRFVGEKIETIRAGIWKVPKSFL